MGKEEKAVIPELLTVRFSKEKNENIIKALRQHQHKNKFKSLNVTIEKVITQALNVK